LTALRAQRTLIFVKRKLPRCHSQGTNVEEALANIRDAIQGYLESLKKHGEPIPEPVTATVVKVSL
jgi:antitoxin HicB